MSDTPTPRTNELARKSYTMSENGEYCGDIHDWINLSGTLEIELAAANEALHLAQRMIADMSAIVRVIPKRGERTSIPSCRTCETVPVMDPGDICPLCERDQLKVERDEARQLAEVWRNYSDVGTAPPLPLEFPWEEKP